MTAVPQLNAIGIVASDMAESIRFYRLLGLDVPETPDEGHVDTFLPNGVRFMLDSEETVRSFRPGWKARKNRGTLFGGSGTHSFVTRTASASTSTRLSSEQFEQLLAAVRDVLGPDLVGAYLFGSAVMGGLRPRSDLDVLVAARRRRARAETQRLVARLLAVSGRP